MAEIGSAYVSILPSARGFGSKLNSQVGGELDDAGRISGSRFGKALRIGATAALGGALLLGGFLKGAVDEAREAQVVTARTENVIAKMGNAANISAAQVAALAGSISAKTGIDDEAIQSGQNLLLTFGKIRNEAGAGNDIFNRTSELMVDMSAAMGTDAKGAALQLGKALNDPIKGVTALTRSGVSFTQQQRDQIATLVESGRTLQAQKVILGEVEKQFGGAAEAMATPADKARVAWDNFREQIGTLLLPLIDRLLTTLTTSVIPAVSTFVAQIQDGTGAGGRLASIVGALADNLDLIVVAIGSVTAGLGAYKAAMAVSAAITAVQTAGTTAATGATWSLNVALRANPIGLVVTALTLLVAGLVIAYKRSETFRGIVNVVWGVLKRLWAILMDNKQILLALLGPLGLFIAAIITAYRKSDTFRGIVDAVIGALKTAITWVGNLAGKLTGALVGAITGVIDKVQSMIEFVRDRAAGAWDTLKSRAISAVTAILTPIQWVIDKVQALINLIESIPGIPGGPAQGNGTWKGGMPKGVVPPTTPATVAGSSASTLSMSSDSAAVISELRALRAAVGQQGREVGREINKAVVNGHKGRAA